MDVLPYRPNAQSSTLASNGEPMKSFPSIAAPTLAAPHILFGDHVGSASGRFGGYPGTAVIDKALPLQ